MTHLYTYVALNHDVFNSSVDALNRAQALGAGDPPKFLSFANCILAFVT